MMYPFNIKTHKIIGVAPLKALDHHGEDGKEFVYPMGFMEVETLFVPKTRSLCIQTHPDWLPEDQKKVFQEYLTEMLETGNIKGNSKFINKFKIEVTFKLEN